MIVDWIDIDSAESCDAAIISNGGMGYMGYTDIELLDLINTFKENIDYLTLTENLYKELARREAL